MTATLPLDPPAPPRGPDAPAPVEAAVDDGRTAPAPDRRPAADPTDARPWRLRRPVLAGIVLYGCAALLLGGIALWWVGERETGRQEGLLTRVHAIEQSGLLRFDPERAIRILEDEVLAQRPVADVRRRALLELAAAFDAATRYDDSDRAYEAARRDWPAGMATGSLVVPWANMLVTAGRAARAKELLADPAAADGYGTPAEVALVRERIARALEAPAVAAPR